MFINKDLKINNHKKFVMVLLGSDSIVFFFYLEAAILLEVIFLHHILDQLGLQICHKISCIFQKYFSCFINLV